MNYEPCTYSPESAGDCLQTLSSDTGQLSLLSGINTPAKSSENGHPKDGSQICECGKGMSDCSIHPSTPEKWIASMRDSLVRTLALLESRQAYLREPDQVFTEKSSASLAWFDRDTCSWKTYQQSFLTDSEPFSETWPRWGMTLGGVAYAHPMSERRITETDGGYFPTPTVSSGAQVAWDKTPKQTGGTTLQGYVKWFPTPTASDPQLERRSKHGNHFQTSTGTVRRKNEDGTSSMLGFAGYVRMFPTPNASDCRDMGNMSMPSIQRRAALGKQLNLSMVAHQTSGALNPDWVSWLMGFPIGFAKVEKK